MRISADVLGRPALGRAADEMLRVLSVPVYLLPDRNVAHFLGESDGQYRNRLDGRAQTRAVDRDRTGMQAGA